MICEPQSRKAVVVEKTLLFFTSYYQHLQPTRLSCERRVDAAPGTHPPSTHHSQSSRGVESQFVIFSILVHTPSRILSSATTVWAFRSMSYTWDVLCECITPSLLRSVRFHCVVRASCSERTPTSSAVDT
jgi:hypothetical protein